MCGITGLWSRDKSWQEKELVRTTDTLSHRGPDAAAHWGDSDHGFYLGHRRLKILDLSDSANQPMRSHDGRLIMVFNGEVYNYKELARELEKERPVAWQTTSDSEVILEGFARHGLNYAGRLNGMFAIGLYDTQLHVLTLIRDFAGIKPLVYFWDGRRLAFASELKALLTLDIPRELNLPAIQDYLHLEYSPGIEAAIKGIFRLQPGCWLQLDAAGNMTEGRYDDLHQHLGKTVQGKDLNDYIEQFETILSGAVVRQLVADVPLGAFLSGGTDSSLIVAMAQKRSPTPLQSFTIGFDKQKFNETVYAEAVAKHLGTNQITRHLDAGIAIATVDKVVSHYDELFAGSSSIPSLIVCSEARSIATVALSGDGGDELFMGYGYYGHYNRLRKLGALGKTGRSMLAGLLELGDEKMSRAARLVNYTDLGSFWIHAWSQSQGMFNAKEVGQLTGAPYKPVAMQAAWERIAALKRHPYESIALFDQQQYLAHDLLYKMDIASMASSLEVRVPYLDREVIDFAINLPLEYRFGPSGKALQQKYLMKETLAKYIPRELVYRPKWGFPAPLGTWLKADLHPMLDRWLSPGAVRKTGVLNPAAVASSRAQFERNPIGWANRLWALLFFQQWHDRYIG